MALSPQGSVLVLRALGLGDAVTGVPALRGVRRAWPRRRILLAGPSATGEWLRGLGLVDEVLPTSGLDSPEWPHGVLDAGRHGLVAVNLHGSGPQSHRLLRSVRPARLVAFADAVTGTPGPAWDDDEHEVDRWCRLVRDAGGACGRPDLRLEGTGPPGHHVVVHPGAASPARRWPEHRYAAVVRHLTGRGADVLVTGGPAESGTCSRVAAAASGPGTATSLAGHLDVPALARTVAAARLVVCGDTGVGHLATAFGTASVHLFGPTPPHRWGPSVDQDRHVVLWHGEAGYVGDPHGSAVDPALASIRTEEVVDAVDHLLQRAPVGVPTDEEEQR
ncbi:ADP-heptose:LPS heptosyltransferase [Isoptericola sp. CG 20/1183]|uniref:ADP-heptose:LPS heptosyltransferase n=1 Tax=Isoptericola halotolerans TaxID=300560 RepID=A0ABX5E9C6_9MICO|nr:MULTISPECIES: glycosyltransferase family 9 protein [Isoptericola]PRZ02661.1 ADP-heptose:LPS heptosyltransferase [Isoptericola sp. CG 20/1183]PRZ03013.1 ADP-heptose:LPS heptosyltransferase [Isoptericola halotolerans]